MGARTFAEMMEGPRRRLKLFNPDSWLTQIGWLGHTGDFYPWPTIPTREQEPRGYFPIYMQDGN